MSPTLPLLLLLVALPARAAGPHEGRRPADEADLRAWLGNMVWHHRFTTLARPNGMVKSSPG